MRRTFVRAAQPDEAAALSALALRSKAHWGYRPAFMAMCVAELTVTPELIDEGLALVAERSGRIAGFIVCTPVDAASAELDMIFVEPEAIGQGIGRLLEVASDPHAEPFYRSCGFEPVGTVPSGSIPGRLLPRLCFALDDRYVVAPKEAR
jgi:GNAT superfamily N-acetyltransferase